MKQEDSHNAFVALIKEHERIIYKICFLYANGQPDREDMYQEIVIQVWKGYKKFRGECKFSTWLYQVALNTAITNVRKERKSPLTYSNDGVLPETPEPTTGWQDEQMEQLYQAINQLNDIEKALVMLYLDGNSYEEMEAIMGVPNGALRVKMTRIKEKLRKLAKYN